MSRSFPCRLARLLLRRGPGLPRVVRLARGGVDPVVLVVVTLVRCVAVAVVQVVHMPVVATAGWPHAGPCSWAWLSARSCCFARTRVTTARPTDAATNTRIASTTMVPPDGVSAS